METPTIVVIISANIEWQVIRKLIKGCEINTSPYGEWMDARFNINTADQSVIFFHGGWGKIAAAGSTQYVIDRWAPDLLINLGTCGGFEGQITKGTIVLVNKTIIYDILEQMGDPLESITHYTTSLDLTWAQNDYPQEVVETLLVSGDRDLVPDEIPYLQEKFGAVAGDWESGAIAYIAARNGTKCLILRGVTDIVGFSGGEAYEDIEVFVQSTKDVLACLIRALPDWLALFYRAGDTSIIINR
jgi:adenosylhomocysteine nucleosidase